MSTPVTRKQVERAQKLVALTRSPNEHEAALAREKALALIAQTDLDYLATLDEQRDKLLADLSAENSRLMRSGERANKTVTGDLVIRAMYLLNHLRNADLLPPAIELIRHTEPRSGDVA